LHRTVEIALYSARKIIFTPSYKINKMGNIKRELHFLEDFPAISSEAWTEKIIQDLKGADYAKKLVWRTSENIDLQPFYRDEDVSTLNMPETLPGQFPYLRGNIPNQREWDIQQEIYVESVSNANAKALEALCKGATALTFVFSGTPYPSDNELAQLLDKIDMSVYPVDFRLPSGANTFFETLNAYLTAQNYDTKTIKGSINISPLNHLTAKGGFEQHQDQDFKSLAETIKEHHSNYPLFRFITIDARLFVEAGASVTAEMGYGLSMASEYLASLSSHGLAVDTILNNLKVQLGIGPNYFLEIAKIRAFRMLWAQMASAYGAPGDDAKKVFLHSTSSKYNKTLYDPYVNMLRLTTEAMSAIAGGCDALTVQPFDEIYGYNTSFADRIARNTQIILKEEAHFDKTIDPAAGSYYIEQLTDKLAEKAWSIFQETEKEGGYIGQFTNGHISANIASMAQKRDMRVASRKETLLGTNQYPNGLEKLNHEVKPDREAPFYTKAANAICEPLKIYRVAEKFEQLRRKTEKSAQPPKVFLLTIGNLTWRKARASFASGFFACAGYEIIDNLGFDTAQEGVESARKQNADIVVVCSSDDEYETVVPEVAQALGSEALLVVAGAPKCMDKLQGQGIEYFIHIKSNVLDTLENFHNLLNINQQTVV